MRDNFDKGHILLFQIATLISAIVIVAEFSLYALAFNEQKSELLKLRSELNIKSQNEISNIGSSNLKPSPLSDIDIELRMTEFSKKVFNLALVSSLFIIFGIVAVFYFIAKQYINPKSIIKKSDQYLKSTSQNGGTQIIHAAKLSGIGEFASTIAHDLKNPLTMVMANLDILFLKNKKNLLTLEDAITHMERIRFSANRIKRLVSHMNRISRDDFDLSKSISINNVFEDSLIILESKIKSNEVELRNKLPEDLKEIHGDANFLEQVIMNLISNAIDAMEFSEEKWVEISAENHEDSITIHLKDSGPGIPDKIVSKIFSPFFTSKEEGKGTGLGLSICKKIIGAHNGEIHVTNALNGGAEFTITLPQTHSIEHQEKMAS